MKLALTTFLSLFGATLSIADVSVIDNGNTIAIEDMESVFQRSDELHKASMAKMMESMTLDKAMALLERSELATSEFAEVKNMVQQSRNNFLKQTSFLKADPIPPPKKGYAGLLGARMLLNSMIHEAFEKYDAEVLDCVDFYQVQCAALYECRSQISSANWVAANGRSMVLNAQGIINWCEREIPTKEQALKEHNRNCDVELSRMKARLKVVDGDIAIMTSILKMTDCDANKKAFIQMNLDVLKCADECTKKSFITFSDQSLREEVKKLQSKFGQHLLHDTFEELFDGVKDLQTVETTLLQTGEDQSPIALNITNFTEPPVQRVEVPGNPCKGQPLPSKATKRASKCTLSKGACYKLQERFMLIQSGMKDEATQLGIDIETADEYCTDTRKTLKAEITEAKSMLDEAEKKLAEATTAIQTAMSRARNTAIKNNDLDSELRKRMKGCNDKYIGYEGEICALRKIRGELYKIKGDKNVGLPFFQDCEVGQWEAEECTKKCGEGMQIIKRSVVSHADGGASCLPLIAKKGCNLQKCPIDCEVEKWSGWTKCSAECGEGVRQRSRTVTQAMMYGGKDCGATSMAESCNTFACEKDCELWPWAEWSACSKDCNTGTRNRAKAVKAPPQGEGTCPDKWDKERLEYKICNTYACPVPAPELPMPCDRMLDVVLLIDGSGSLGQTGWNAEIKMAETFVDAFQISNTKMAVILYSGPFTWPGVWKCMGGKKVDLATDCNVRTVQHFDRSMKKTKAAISGLSWPQGSTLTSLALMTAKAELNLGREDARSIIVVITDGRPMSYRNTGIAARSVRKVARLVWVPVTRYAPLGSIKRWATRRWQENLVKVESFEDLKNKADDIVSQIIADICPKWLPM